MRGGKMKNLLKFKVAVAVLALFTVFGGIDTLAPLLHGGERKHASRADEQHA
jgi:hypothetical protein